MVNGWYAAPAGFAENASVDLKQIAAWLCEDVCGVNKGGPLQPPWTGRMFGSLFKLGFWGGLVLLVIPIDTGEQENKVSALEALLAARETVADIRGMCERKPEVCETGGAALETIKARAAASARMALAYIDEQRPAAPQSN